MENRKITITGANSFIGTYFMKNSSQFQINEVDLLIAKPSEIDFTKSDVVFHVAAIVHQDKAIPDSTYFEVNSNLAFNVAYKAKQDGIKQFVFMSTVKVYGENSTKENPWTEDSACFPSDAYGKSKLEAEKRIMELNDENFTVSIIRTPVVYGAGVKGNIQKIARFVKAQRFIPFKGVSNKRAMVYIGNLIALIQKVIENNASGIFLAGDGQLLSTSDFVKLLIDVSIQKKYFISIPKLLQYTLKALKPDLYIRLFGSQIIDNKKTFDKLNFNCPYAPEYGLKEVMESL